MAAAYEALRFSTDVSEKVWDDLAAEEALQININGQAFTVIMCTPGNEEEMARGLLHSEDLYTSSAQREMQVTNRNERGVITEVNFDIPESELGSGYLSSRSMLSVSSCGICGKRELGDLTVKGDPLAVTAGLQSEIVPHLFEKMEKAQATFQSTGGTHAAAIFTLQGEMLTIMEDIGRHNAVDKAVGSLIMQGLLHKGKVLTVSGRVSYEIVTKAFRAHIPILAAVSAPSSLAVDYAKELGITLLGFCRGSRYSCYSNPQRILANFEGA